MNEIHWATFNSIHHLTKNGLCVGEERKLTGEEIDQINTALTMAYEQVSKAKALFTEAAERWQGR